MRLRYLLPVMRIFIPLCLLLAACAQAPGPSPDPARPWIGAAYHHHAVAVSHPLAGRAALQILNEGGTEMAATVAAIVDAGVPVLGHVGLLPQKAEHRGAFKIQGRDDIGAKKVIADANAIAKAGAFAMVIEGTVEPVAREITAQVEVPTIGIGASPACDGQILVTQDMVGLFADFTPKFVKRYADLGTILEQAVKQYADEVRGHKFPGLEHCFGVEKK